MAQRRRFVASGVEWAYIDGANFARTSPTEWISIDPSAPKLIFHSNGTAQLGDEEFIWRFQESGDDWRNHHHIKATWILNPNRIEALRFAIYQKLEGFYQQQREQSRRLRSEGHQTFSGINRYGNEMIYRIDPERPDSLWIIGSTNEKLIEQYGPPFPFQEVFDLETRIHQWYRKLRLVEKIFWKAMEVVLESYTPKMGLQAEIQINKRSYWVHVVYNQFGQTLWEPLSFPESHKYLIVVE